MTREHESRCQHKNDKQKLLLLQFLRKVDKYVSHCQMRALKELSLSKTNSEINTNVDIEKQESKSLSESCHKRKHYTSVESKLRESNATHKVNTHNEMRQTNKLISSSSSSKTYKRCRE